MHLLLLLELVALLLLLVESQVLEAGSIDEEMEDDEALREMKELQQLEEEERLRIEEEEKVNVDKAIRLGGKSSFMATCLLATRLLIYSITNYTHTESEAETNKRRQTIHGDRDKSNSGGASGEKSEKKVNERSTSFTPQGSGLRSAGNVGGNTDGQAQRQQGINVDSTGEVTLSH